MLARSLVLAALSAIPLSAQDSFQIYPERNGSAGTFVSRAGGGASQVELLAEVAGNMIAGVGDVTGGGASGLCVVTGYFAYFVDEDPSTAEQLDIVFHDVDAATGGPGVEIGRVGPFTTPTLTTTTRSTILFSVMFATPFQVPCQGTWFHGLDLPAAPLWPATDGIALYVAYYSPPATRNVGDNPRVGAPNISWQIVQGSTTQVPTPMTLRMGPYVTTPMLTVGGIDPANIRQTPTGSPNYGAGGLFPDVTARSDGITLLIESTNHAGGLAYGFVSLGLTPTVGFPVFGFRGELWLNPIMLIPLGSVSLPTGSGNLNVFSPGSIPPSAAGVQLSFQALVAGGLAGIPTFTNATSTSF